jgi:hypothetical protein
MKRNWKNKIPLMILAGMAGVTAFTALVMVLWNAILPAVLHTSMITFWQAAGILLLSRILFGGFKGRHRRMGGGCYERKMEWRQHRRWEPAPAPVTQE